MQSVRRAAPKSTVGLTSPLLGKLLDSTTRERLVRPTGLLGLRRVAGWLTPHLGWFAPRDDSPILGMPPREAVGWLTPRPVGDCPPDAARGAPERRRGRPDERPHPPRRRVTRPVTRPVSARMPLLVRSRTRARSNEAAAPSTCSVNSPCGLAVSTGSRRLRKNTPRACRASTTPSRWESERARRSSETTARVSSAMPSRPPGDPRAAERRADGRRVKSRRAPRNGPFPARQGRRAGLPGEGRRAPPRTGPGAGEGMGHGAPGGPGR